LSKDDPAGILGHPEVTRQIDFREPVGVLLVTVPHFVPDADDPAGIVSRLTRDLAPAVTW
jgi:S-adenosyl methyltransferase